MRWIAGLAAVLALGLVLGYVVRDQVTDTRTTTVVQIVTTAPTPAPTHSLTAVVEGPKGACLTQPMTDHTFSLRGESNGLNSGDILALAKSASMDAQACLYILTFSISPDLGFFYVRDEDDGHKWGPFDSHNLAARHWNLLLAEPR